MTTNLVTLQANASIVDAARKMKDEDIGDVIVTKSNKSICGIVTDRDLVVRGLADGKDPAKVTLDEVCTHEVTTVRPDDELSMVVELMREKAIRRIPVTDNGEPVGIISLGDLAQTLDRQSALGEISATPPNN
jgi:signal-transduction protein with cAMP-binding, CBS, and nucleotidyltransferase domain